MLRCNIGFRCGVWKCSLWSGLKLWGFGVRNNPFGVLVLETILVCISLSGILSKPDLTYVVEDRLGNTDESGISSFLTPPLFSKWFKTQNKRGQKVHSLSSCTSISDVQKRGSKKEHIPWCTINEIRNFFCPNYWPIQKQEKGCWAPLIPVTVSDNDPPRLFGCQTDQTERLGPGQSNFTLLYEKCFYYYFRSGKVICKSNEKSHSRINNCSFSHRVNARDNLEGDIPVECNYPVNDPAGAILLPGELFIET